MCDQPSYEELAQRVRDLEKSNAEGREAEETLRTRERFLSTILRTSAEGFWLIDIHGFVTDANEAYCKASGYTREELLGLHISDIDIDEAPGETEERIRRIIANGSELFEARHRRKDGSVFPVEISVTYLDEAGGKFVCFSRDLTERKRAEEALGHSRHLLGYIIEHANSAVAVHDRDLRYIYVSQRYLDEYNVRERDVIGKHHYEVFPDLPRKWRDVHQKALAGEVSRADRDPYPREDGTVEWTRWECRPWHEPDGSIGGFIIYTEVITEWVRAEEALRESERVLKATQRLAKTGGWEWDVEKQTMSWTDEAYRIHDFDPEEFEPGSSSHIERSQACYAPEDRSVILEAFRRCVEQGEPYDLELPFTTAKGRRLWIRTTAEAVRVNGRVAKVVGNIMDITDRKLAEEQRIQSHDLLSNLARMVPGVIYQYRLYPDGRSAFPYASPGMNDIYEVTPEEVREDATPVYGRLHPEDYDHVVEAIQESARTLQTFYCEFRVMLPRQGLRWRWSQAHPERMDDGSTLWHGIILDVTDRKNAEEEKEKLRVQLIQAQKMESVGRLAGGVAHDFNNMLGVILGYTELALDKLDGTDRVQVDLEEVLKAARRSADMTRQLLAFSRQQTIAPKRLDLNETVESMLKMLRRLMGEDIHISWHPGARLWPVYMDPTQLDQILVNLCVNSRDAIADVGAISIETDTKTFDEAYCRDHAGFVPGDFVSLSVSDDGCGMDETTRDKVFEPFFTTKEQGKGTGLGLATVYGIVKQNDGFITIYSEPGQGTTFRIYLPRHEAATEQAPKKRSVELDARGTETILLVEDEKTILTMTTRMLERLGYRVLAAGTPDEAMGLAKEHAGRIHLLMTDVIMPHMNGRDLAARLHDLYPEIQVLFMSGYTADVIAHRGVLYEGVNFIQKPFSKQDLAVKIRDVLDETSPPTHGS